MLCKNDLLHLFRASLRSSNYVRAKIAKLPSSAVKRTSPRLTLALGKEYCTEILAMSRDSRVTAVNVTTQETTVERNACVGVKLKLECAPRLIHPSSASVTWAGSISVASVDSAASTRPLKLLSHRLPSHSFMHVGAQTAMLMQ